MLVLLSALVVAVWAVMLRRALPPQIAEPPAAESVVLPPPCAKHKPELMYRPWNDTYVVNCTECYRELGSGRVDKLRMQGFV